MTLVKVPVPWKGMDLCSEPDSLAAGKGTLLRNALPGRQGQVVPRGPLGFVAATKVTAFDNTSSGAGGFWLAPNGSTLQQAGSGSNVSKDGGAPFAIPGGGLYITASFTQMSNYVVGCTGAISAVSMLYTWDGNTTMVQLTNGPPNIDAVASHLNRVFAMSSSTLFWTDPNPNLPANTAAMWQDDVSGLTNQIPLPPGERYREVVEFNRALYIIGQNSVYALLGDTPSSFTLRKVLELGAGALSGYSYAGHAAASNRGLYFWSYNGLVRFDGATATVVSNEVAPLVNARMWHRIDVLDQEYISVITEGSWLLMHEPTGAWASMTSSLFPKSTVHNGVAGLPTLIRCNNPGALGAWSAFSAGENSSATAGISVSMRLGADDAAIIGGGLSSGWLDGGTALVDVQVVSASIRLSTPDRLAQIQRLYAQAGCGGWTVQVEDEAGVAIGPPATLVTGTKRARAEAAPGFTENDLVRVRWTWDGTVGARLPSIGDAYLLTDAAQQR